MSPIKVVLDDFSKNPTCRHGPKVLLQRTSSGKNLEQFYACTASRDGKCCGSLENQKNSSTKNIISNRRNHKQSKTVDTKEPTRHLVPLSFDGEEAQYFFTDTALSCFESIFTQLKITKVLCIGAPRLHEHLLQKTSIDSLLLDIDDRFHDFYSNRHFIHYNMFNHHFFRGNADQEMFEHFLENVETSSRICIFTDPPFGCRTELLANTIRRINLIYNRINSLVQHILPTFWIFPYFMETYIQKEMPSMEMADYRVNYTNHKAYCEESKSLKHGSPVRFFTNVPLNIIRIPPEEDYRFCDKCSKSVLKTNLHCSKCKNCPSKNAATYKHCSYCNICVKPNYKHCYTCGRCTQQQGHNCQLYRKMASCRICMGRGHVEKSCTFWKRYGRKMFQVGCAVCGSKAHILRDCTERKVLIKEDYFLGEYCNEINLAI